MFCVLQYNISLSDNAGNSFVGTVNVSNPQLSIRVDVKDIIGNVTLDMCRYRYTFQVAAVNGKEITPPTSPAIDFSGTHNVYHQIRHAWLPQILVVFCLLFYEVLELFLRYPPTVLKAPRQF